MKGRIKIMLNNDVVAEIVRQHMQTTAATFRGTVESVTMQNYGEAKVTIKLWPAVATPLTPIRDAGDLVQTSPFPPSAA